MPRKATFKPAPSAPVYCMKCLTDSRILGFYGPPSKGLYVCEPCWKDARTERKIAKGYELPE